MDWQTIDDLNNIKNLDLAQNEQYLCLMECWDGAKMVWKAIIANFYKTGDDVTVYDNKGAAHHFDIPQTGFYYVNLLPNISSTVIQLNEVRYYTKIDYPTTEPDSFLTIEN